MTFGTAAAQAAKAATTTTLIVMAYAGDPVGDRLVASLARPGGNITGMSLATAELYGKRLELLKKIAPKLTRLTVFGDLSRQAEALHQRLSGAVDQLFAGGLISAHRFEPFTDLAVGARDEVSPMPAGESRWRTVLRPMWGAARATVLRLPNTQPSCK